VHFSTHRRWVRIQLRPTEQCWTRSVEQAKASDVELPKQPENIKKHPFQRGNPAKTQNDKK
jgi:hypothetical protein